MHSPSMTKQHFKDECDVNQIVGRFQATGELPNVSELPPQFLDVTEMDFQAHQNFIAEAHTMFSELPSALRAQFENSPAKFLDFCSHEKNRPELAEMGLLRPSTPDLAPYSHPIPPDGPTASKEAETTSS